MRKLNLNETTEKMKKNDGSLDLVGTDVEALPDNLLVKDLVLAGSQIRELPNDLVVEGDCYLCHTTKLKSLPKDLKVKGSLIANDSNLEEIPENLEIGGYLDLRYTPIKELPSGLKVGKFLDIRNSRIQHLPEDLIVRSNIICDYGFKVEYEQSNSNGKFLEKLLIY